MAVIDGASAARIYVHAENRHLSVLIGRDVLLRIGVSRIPRSRIHRRGWILLGNRRDGEDESGEQQ
jgi:hypothetical protein